MTEPRQFSMVLSASSSTLRNSKLCVLLKDGIISNTMRNDVSSLLEAQKHVGVRDFFHLALGMVLLKADARSYFFFNLETWPYDSSWPWKRWWLAFSWLLCPSCTFLTEHFLCTCSNGVLSDKHLASPENCSIKSQPQLWGSTLIESPLRGFLSQFPREESFLPWPLFRLELWPKPLFSSQHALLWLLALTQPCGLCSTLGSSTRQAWVALGSLESPILIMSIFILGEEVNLSVLCSLLLPPPEINANGSFDILSMIW